MTFAAEFLMPERDIKHELTDLTLDRLVGLKLRWKVSMQALLKRAQDLGVIAIRKARYLWMQMGRAGYRLREPAESYVAPERPSVLRQIFDVYQGPLGYSAEDLADLVALQPDELEGIYDVAQGPGTPRRLRLVGTGSMT